MYLPENREAELVKTLSQTPAFQGLARHHNLPRNPQGGSLSQCKNMAVVTVKKQLLLENSHCALIKFLFNIFPIIKDPTASFFGQTQDIFSLMLLDWK